MIPAAAEMPEPEERGEREARDYRALVGTLGAVALLLLFACLMWWLLSQRAEVPDIVGMPQDEARIAIAKAGFVVGEVTTETGLPSEAGLAMDQSPDGGRRALKGSEVDFVIAAGLAAGGSGGPAYGETGVSTDGVDIFALPPGEASPPAPDQGYYVAPGSLGPQVPSAQALSESAARSRLTAAGYGVAVKHGKVSTNLDEGLVYFQDPAPGAYEPRGTLVTIWISAGPPPDYVPPVE